MSDLHVYRAVARIWMETVRRIINSAGKEDPRTE